MEGLLERFKRYVQVNTAAKDDTDDYPSSPGQWELARILEGELKEMGLDELSVSEYAIVMATIPGNVPNAPTIAWLAHMDTSPEASGKDVKPIVHENYDGKDIVLPGDTSKVIKVDEHTQLKDMVGKTIITSDGTTLLGGDDKAGIAIIMTVADHLMKNPDIKHGPIRICFSCDEEIGRGADHIELKDLHATAAYTLDGEGHGGIEAETFSADLATVNITGQNSHPGFAKNKMVNAIRICSEFIARMPWQTLSPETTAGMEPFMHPYVLEGGVDKAKIKILLRSFDTEDLSTQADLLNKIGATLEAEFPKAKVEVDVKKQYRNMRDGLKKEPRAVDKVKDAMTKLGMDYKIESIRGGTDGSRLTEMGLPTPNLSAGMHNFHCAQEFACLEEMDLACQVLVGLAQCWAE